MRISDALRRKGKKQRISSIYLSMYNQNRNSFVYWLLTDVETTDEEKVVELKRILTATDWEIEKDE